MHFASYYRWLVFRELFGSPPPGITLLDVGCDDGGFIARIPARLSVATDLSPQALLRVSADARVCADGTQLPFHAVSFDYVFLSDVVEHVPNDAALVANARAQVRPGGTLLLSTTADAFQLFPPAITPRAERAWGHVRKGYTRERLTGLIGDEFEQTVIRWPEQVFRTLFVVMWLIFKVEPPLARLVAGVCFQLDRQLRRFESQRGHIYIRAVRRRP